MITFNLIGKGFLHMEDNPSFKTENQQFRFADISIGRTVEFSIPATKSNRRLLGFSDEPGEVGEDMRVRLTAQMVYDGGVIPGTFAVTGYSSDEFSCVFYMGGAAWIDDLQDKKLKDCVCSFSPVTWIAGGNLVDADQADPTQGVQVIKYDSPLPAWRLPSVNVKTYIDDILVNLGIQHDLTQLSTDYWMTACSIKGGASDSVTFTQTDWNNASETETNPGTLFSVVDIMLQWSKNTIFMTAFDGGSWPSKAFKARYNCAMTFAPTFPNGVYLIKWNKDPKRCEVLGGVDTTGKGNNLKGKTVDLAGGDIIFFANKPYYRTSNYEYYGWREYKNNFSVTVDVEQNYELSGGATPWKIQLNAPDMTVFEFLQSVAIATGLELFVDATDGITLKAGSYGQAGDFKSLADVISVEEVNRNVDAWGDGTRKTVVKFDSEDYVFGNLEAVYDIDNEHNDDIKEVSTKFSEGAIGDHGVLIDDGAYDNGYQLKATKWTLTRVDLNATYPDYLQRVDVPTFNGYDDIAMQSTCIKVKVAASESEFFGITASTTFLWRGMAYVWTDADWADGIMSLTLQKVSQPSLQIANPTPYLTLTAGIGGAAIRLDKKGTDSGTLNASLEYSTDGGVTWQVYGWTGNTGDTITLGEGDSVRWRGNNATFSTSFDSHFQFIIANEVTVSGDVTSLLSNNCGDVALSAYCFAFLFNATPIKNSPNMPSTTLADYCYYGTFYGCNKMETASELPATTLARSCYHYLFNGCSMLASAPVLSAETLAASCYSYIFSGCTLIDEVEMHATDISATNCLTNWLNSVAAVGVLRCDPSLTLASGASGIPTGWKRQTIEGYQLVEYLESSGTQYIDTHVIGDQDTEIVAEWMANSISVQYLYGAVSSGNTASVTAYISSSGNWRFGNQAKLIASTANVWHKTIHNITGIDYDGTLYAYGNTTPSFATPYSIILYCNHSTTGTIGTVFFRGKIKAFVISSNGVKVIDYYPVVVGGVGYMYDNEAHELHGNDGTGDFIVGPDV